MSPFPTERGLASALHDLAEVSLGSVDFDAVARRVRRRRQVRGLAAGAAVCAIALGLGLSQTVGGQGQSVRIIAPPSSVPSTTVGSQEPAAQLAEYVSTAAVRDEQAASAAGKSWGGSLNTAPIQDGNSLIAVAAFSYDATGKPVQVLRYGNGQWTEEAALPSPPGTGESSLWLANRADLGNLASISVGDLTGDGLPDFLVPLNAADNVPGAVISQDGASGGWRYVPYRQGASPTQQFLFARDARIQDGRLVTTYDSCNPSCATSKPVAVTWIYEPGTGAFWAPNPSSKPATAPPGSTTAAVPAVCSPQQFTSTIVTDHPDYTRGQTVNITMTMTNSGPSCEGVPPWFCGQSASIYDSSHTDVWDSGAGPNNPQDIRSCPAGIQQTIGHGSSSSESLAWQQDRCTFDNQSPAAPNPDCPATQVPDGTYTVAGDSSHASAVTISISG